MASMAATSSFALSLTPSSKLPKIHPPIKLQSCAALKFRQLKQNHRKFNVVKASAPGLYSADKFDLTSENVDKVLDNVRPYLIADGGNVDVVSVANGVVSLKLQGACESCPSSTTTMKMGIERVLKEKFGDAIKDICQAINRHLDILRPAIKNYGGSVQVLSVVAGGECLVKYIGPESIGSGIKAAIKERFPDIANVELTN
ncbi:nifu-like protein 1 chloroplastic [Phtheirospermum japonicum]|uniref:Nifu-like protein 1 chloroplastic n=1 Tax=Phtheirospermum japonicum TaxID=374723 RepID=A0A830C3E3_9LAMI|nr:nifu-like protein 1 chloroplastic [Phtheirospermum japonicum]